ncbi:hypothetical protein SDC9_158948 [bioreactor metagenome]|uniref:Uncharacterized protein n=1 Tax=bioreactor metagenome TaxID=1076179 RepID=A0A645FGM5_9ZZZZ
MFFVSMRFITLSTFLYTSFAISSRAVSDLTNFLLFCASITKASFELKYLGETLPDAPCVTMIGQLYFSPKNSLTAPK